MHGIQDGSSAYPSAQGPTEAWGFCSIATVTTFCHYCLNKDDICQESEPMRYI